MHDSVKVKPQFIPNSSFLDSEQVTVDSNEDFGQRFRQQILFVGGHNFIIYTWDDTACLEQHYQTQPQNNFVFLIAGGGGGYDGVVMMSVWLLRIIILLVKRYCNRIESINFTYTNIVCVSGSVWAKKSLSTDTALSENHDGCLILSHQI